MASSNATIQSLKGTWDYVDGNNFDEYLREMGEMHLLIYSTIVTLITRYFMDVTSSC